MPPLSPILVASLLLASIPDPIAAAKDAAVNHVAQAETSMVILVFEAPSCNYCDLFRRNVHPLYEQSARAQRVPMRFVDALNVDAEKLGLSAPITMLPTVVFMQDGEEVERLAGYTGPETFFQAVAHVMR